jgi:hypothetical protein
MTVVDGGRPTRPAPSFIRSGPLPWACLPEGSEQVEPYKERRQRGYHRLGPGGEEVVLAWSPGTYGEELRPGLTDDLKVILRIAYI